MVVADGVAPLWCQDIWNHHDDISLSVNMKTTKIIVRGVQPMSMWQNGGRKEVTLSKMAAGTGNTTTPPNDHGTLSLHYSQGNDVICPDNRDHQVTINELRL